MALKGLARDISLFFRRKTYSDLVSFLRRSGEIGCDGSKTSLRIPKTQLKEYRSWIFNCTNLIQNKVSTTPFGFYRTETGEKLDSRNRGYRVFTKPFYKPNDFMSFRFIRSFCQLQLDLCGMACILKLKNNLGQVWELWPLNMNDFVKIEMSNKITNPNISFLFNINNNMVSFSLDDLIFLRYPHPTKLWEGMSPIQAQAYSCDLDRYIEVYEKDFFQNSARVDMVLSTDEELGEEAATIVKERWKEKNGHGHFHDIAVLHSGLKPIPMKYTNKDFEFLALADWSKSKIVGAYNIPMAKFSSSGANRAESVTAEIVFNRECIQPRLTIWDEELTKDVIHTFDDRIDFWHDNPIPRDRDLEMKEARIYLAGFPAMRPNEFRTKTLGLEEIDGLSEFFIPRTFIPLGKLDEYIANDLNNNSSDGNKPNGDATDPTRHDNDEPHVTPDGDDDRDTNPTPGRSYSGKKGDIEFNSNTINVFEDKSRIFWNKHLLETLNTISNDGISEENIKSNIESAFEYLINVTGTSLFKYYRLKLFVKDSWAFKIAKMGSREFTKQIMLKNKDKDQDFGVFINALFDSDARLSKIINTLLRATINYSKYEILDYNGKKIIWKIQSNACGHRGRIKNLNIDDNGYFEVGNTKMRFPGENILNFDCDCTIEQGD